MPRVSVGPPPLGGPEPLRHPDEDVGAVTRHTITVTMTPRQAVYAEWAVRQQHHFDEPHAATMRAAAHRLRLALEAGGWEQDDDGGGWSAPDPE